MADIGRAELLEAAMRGDNSPTPEVRNFYQGVRARADTDPDRALEMMGGREPNPGQIRANLEESIGIRGDDGKMVRDAEATSRFTRADTALTHLDRYLTHESFNSIPAPQKDAMVDYVVNNILKQHPDFRGYLNGLTPFNRDHVAKEIAIRYLSDPETRKHIQTVAREIELADNVLPDNVSDAERALLLVEKQETMLRQRKRLLEGGTADGIGYLRKRKKAFAPGGTGLTEIATAKADISTKSTVEQGKRRAYKDLEAELEAVQRELLYARGIKPIPRGVTPRSEAVLVAEISRLRGEVDTAEDELNTASRGKEEAEAKLQGLIGERGNIDERIAEKMEELASVNDELAKIIRQRGDLQKLRTAKANHEEKAVVELERVFARGIEKQLHGKYSELQLAAHDEAKKRVDSAGDNTEKIYEQAFVDRYLHVEVRNRLGRTAERFCRINGTQINTDYQTLLSDPITVAARGGGVTVAEGMYLTGPEQVVLEMVNGLPGLSNSEKDALMRDKSWLGEQSERVAQEVLKQKYIASREKRGMVHGEKVKKFQKGELDYIASRQWAKDWLTGALQANQDKQKMLEQALGAGAIDNLNNNPDAFWSRIRGNKAALFLILIALGIVGGVAAPVIASTGLAIAQGVGSAMGGKAVAGAAVGGAAGAVVGRRVA